MKDNPFYEKFLIKDLEHWRVYLHENQNYLGRSYLWAKREDAIDFFDMNSSELEEYMQTGLILRNSLISLFQPDLFNYATLGNVTGHLHTHFIPRYETPRIFEGIEFADENWGRNYAPYNKEFQVPEEVLFGIRDAIKDEMDMI